ncbi:MAG TPA: tetratricopeptide repeat protein [Pseudonocardiaceae bacterium]|nr:tetratricopeptide repeat protein [Pseudonocardiaceae bacterium]
MWGNADVVRWVVVVILLGLIPVYYWQRKRSRTRHAAMHAELTEIGRLHERGADVEAAHRCVALQDKCSRPDSALDREVIFKAADYLASARVQVGSLADAETDLGALLEELGPDRRPDLRSGWLTLANFGWVAIMRGRYAEGIEIAERVVRECVRRWGEDAPVLQSARRILASCLIEVGRAEEALPILTAEFEDALAKSGEDSVLTMHVRHSLAEAQLNLGLLDEAEAGFVLVLSGFESHLDHLAAAAGARFGLAKIAALRGRIDEAAEGFTRVLTELQDTAGPTGPWTMHTRFELAELDARAGNADAALATHRSVLADRIHVLGPDHPDTVRSRAAVAERTG